MESSPSLIDALRARGVIIHCPEATIVRDIDPTRFEAGVEIFPGTTVTGARSLFGAGTRLGRAGGGWFEDVRTGRGCDLYGGTFEDCVLLDGVIVRGHAELRGGTLLEEGCEAAHHVGYKMTVMLPYVVAGSLINFCDALFAGGTSRKDHSEIGSALALYNYTPWGDKFASLFGDVPRGVFLRSPRIFVGGQAQVVSPVTVGFGAVVAAGSAVRRDVPEGRLYGEGTPPIDMDFDPDLYGGVLPKLVTTARYIGNLRALELWYERVRLPSVSHDPLATALYAAAIEQLRAGVKERIKRIDQLVARLPASREKHAALLQDAPLKATPLHQRRIAEHDAIITAWPTARGTQSERADALGCDAQALDAIADAWPSGSYPDAVRKLDGSLVDGGIAALQAVVDTYAWPLAAGAA
ncbi:MAG: UDP-N-acetylglucosamine pyrophosphorylase [Myxococcales bacterium]|nr:UDP-N-acetylglucosamine pyrophosphorylase [Myxococcales bacterium]